MISDPALYRRRFRILPVAFVLSLLLHVVGILIYGVATRRLPWLTQPPHREPVVVLSSSTNVSRITVPYIHQPVTRGRKGSRGNRAEPRIAQPQQRAAPPRQARRIAVAPPQAFHELTVPAPSAAPMPSPEPSRPAHGAPRAHVSTRQDPSHFTQMLAREQPVYRREIAQLQRQNNPLSVATIQPRPASAFRRAYFNVSGVDTNLDRYEGLITPTRTWSEGNLRCHYADYEVQYAYGGADKGSIPWPLCYRPDSDPMMLPDGTLAPTGTPVPSEDLVPMPGYVKPRGYYLTPFLQSLYDRRPQ